MERLKRRTDFRAIAQTGARAPAKAFVLQALRRDEQGQEFSKESGNVRIGFTVSRQVGNAVERNRVRRRLREMVRGKPATAFTPGYDYVLIGRRTALTCPFGDMARELDGALRRIATGVRNKTPLHRAGSEQAGQRHGTLPRTTAKPAKEH
ncbi:MAG TPA: ribonuclease P protein component [Xanthobacteraceae bacterium]|nr:ribonuclease P protein component [Xanthobacteraceae bacterium]